MTRRIAHGAVVLLASVLCADAAAECREAPFAEVGKSVVADRTWVDGVPMWIADLSIDADGARRDFAAYWRRSGGEVRTQRSNGVEVASSLKGGCLYALQIAINGSAPPRLVISDLHIEQPKLPRSFEWPLPADGVVMSDSVSVDRNRVGRLLVYRTDANLDFALKRVVQRLGGNEWKISSIMRLNGITYTFSTRKGDTALDVTVVKNGSGSTVTLNFSQLDR